MIESMLLMIEDASSCAGSSDEFLAPGGAPRFQRPDREQMRLMPLSLDDLVAADHRVRGVWSFVQQLDLSPLYASIRAREGRAGRSPIDPRILTALWLYATVESVGSARALARLCEEHQAYRWICGGVGVNYHALADFRTAHAEVVDGLLTQSVTALMAGGLVNLDRVAHDGVRVRASAGSNSFHRQETLERLAAQAEEQVQRLKREVAEDPGATQRRQQAAGARAARERQERVAEALRHLPEIQRKRKQAGSKGPARVSTSDPDARIMMMPGGGFQPAYNAQLATDTKNQVIVGVRVTNQNSDQGLMAPMIEQLRKRYGRTPGEYLADGGFVKNDDIAGLAQTGTKVYAPVPKPKQEDRAAHQSCPTDSAAVAQWRQRMSTEEGQQIYKERASTAECVNAQARNRGLTRFLVRGLEKVRGVLLWFALAHNLMRWITLRGAIQAA